MGVSNNGASSPAAKATATTPSSNSTSTNVTPATNQTNSNNTGMTTSISSVTATTSNNANLTSKNSNNQQAVVDNSAKVPTTPQAEASKLDSEANNEVKPLSPGNNIGITSIQAQTKPQQNLEAENETDGNFNKSPKYSAELSTNDSLISNNNNINSSAANKSIAPSVIPSAIITTTSTAGASSPTSSGPTTTISDPVIIGGNNLTSGAYYNHESNGSLTNKEHGGNVRSNSAKSDSNTNHQLLQNQQQQQQQNSYHHNKQPPHLHQHHQHHNNQQQSHQHQTQDHSHHHNSEQLSKTNLYIRGLSADTSDNDLFSLCNRYGSIVSTKAILDKNTNKCKGYGFVDFETPAAAEVAVVELQKQGVLVHMAKQQEADPTNLYIANLPHLMSESELENLLRPYGQVVSTRILINQNRQPRGVGFARMETKEQCDSIIASLNGQIVKGSKEPLLVKFADGASKKRVHHFQHKPLGGNAFIGDHLWRNSSNDTNYHMMNSGPSNRNFHGGSFDHSRQNHAMSHHNNGLVKHQQMMSSMSGYHPHHQGGGHHSHSSAHHNHQHHQSHLQQNHHGHNHSSHSSHRNHNQGQYTGGSNFPLSASMSGSNDAAQWLHPPQAGQP